MPDFKNIVILTDAGISAESGIKTFHDADGLWENHAIGTSAQVTPAATFVKAAKSSEAHCVEFNLEETPMGPYFDERIVGLASVTVPTYIKSLF